MAALAARDRRRERPESASQAAVTALEAAAGSEARQHAALAFWDAVVDAADSIVFRLLFNSLRLAYEPAIAAAGPGDGGRGRQRRRLPRAEPTPWPPATPSGARAAADDLLRPATEAISHLLSLIDEERTRR